MVRPLSVFACLALAASGAACAAQGRVVLSPGDRAPGFRLKATDDREYALEQFRGKSSVALVWFLRAGSGGSRTQLSVIQGKLEEIARYRVQVLGITTSSLEECKEFAKELKLTFPLLSDPDRTVAAAYGTLRNGTGPTCERWVFLIDEQGVIRSIEKSEAVADKANLLLQTLDPQKYGTAAPAPSASAAESAQPATAAPAAPAVTSSAATVAGRRYAVYRYTVPGSKSFSVVIPDGLKTVRGVLVVANHAGGDSRDYWIDCTYYREFMPLHGFAFVGSEGNAGSHLADLQALHNCLRTVGAAAHHPELVNAPYAAAGFSYGGGFASHLMTLDPERTIAAGLYGTRYNFKEVPYPASPSILGIPAVLITGELEHMNDPNPQTGVRMIDEVFVPYRPMGALYAWIERQGIGHEYAENRQDVVAMPMLDAAVRARYPKDGDVTKGPVRLRRIDPATGWIADNTTWKSGITRIYPARQFRGDLGHSSWLLNEDVAFIYRAYATYDKPLKVISPGNCWPTVPALDPGADVPIVVDASGFPNWTRIAFFDGARKLGEITQGPTQWTARDLTPGYHVFSVLAWDAQGNVRTSDPAMVVVRLLP